MLSHVYSIVLGVKHKLTKYNIMEKYVLITWPDSQTLMEKEWFDECILMNDENHLNEIGSSAYFVPEERIKEL